MSLYQIKAIENYKIVDDNKTKLQQAKKKLKHQQKLHHKLNKKHLKHEKSRNLNKDVVNNNEFDKKVSESKLNKKLDRILKRDSKIRQDI